MVDMLGEADVAVNATPAGMGAQNFEETHKKLSSSPYMKAGRKIAQLLLI